MLVSAVLCTHNRQEHLRIAIESLTRQTLSARDFEILVVDNASSDETASLVSELQREVKNLVYVFEPRLGLNNARNTGWRRAQADIVAFLDDDAVADTNWLQRIVDKFSQYDVQTAAIGGKVEPWWEEPPPSWLETRFWPSLSVLDLSHEDKLLDRHHYFVGANMAIRTQALAKVGGFHPFLDRQGRNLLSNGEVHLKWRLEAAGYQAYYCPEIKVCHLVPKERMTQSWFRQRYYWHGISDERLYNSFNPRARGIRSWIRTCLRTTRDSVHFAGRWSYSRMLGSWQSRSIQSRLDEKYKMGVLVEKWTAMLS
jgi:glycosyltransferase involved in cell wall biosynthesis